MLLCITHKLYMQGDLGACSQDTLDPLEITFSEKILMSETGYHI